MNNKLSKLKEDFLQYIKSEKSYNQKTIKNYNLYLERFLSYVSTDSPNDITQKKTKAYRKWLKGFKDKRGEKLQPNTRNYHLIALRSFLSFLSTKGLDLVNSEQIKLFQNNKKNIVIATDDELKQIFAQITDNRSNKLSLRDKSILKLILNTGLKVSKITKLKQKQIKDCQLNLKNKRLRLDKECVGSINQYLNSRKDKNPFLFISHDKRTKQNKEHKPLSSRSIQRMIKKYVRKAGINKKITPSSLRHAYAKKLVEENKEISEIRDQLSHSSISSTKLYIESVKNAKK